MTLPTKKVQSQRHAMYYLADGNTIFSVGGTLYKLSRQLFARHSTVFDGLFAIPQPLDEASQGLCDENPIYLPGVEPSEFDCFLAVLCPSDYMVYLTSTVDEWTSVLSIATRWEFTSIRQLSIVQLSSITSPVDKIVLGRRHNIQSWLTPAFVSVCMRATPLSLDEGLRIGLADVIFINELRHGIRYPTNFNRDPDTIAMLVDSRLSRS